MGSKSKMPAARIGDVDTGHPPAPPTPVITGSPNVLINGRPAARVNDMLIPHHPGVRLIKEGSNSVLINGQPAARVTDGINCGGVLVTGSSNVFIGDNPKPPRNEVLELEFEAYMEASFKPENMRLDPKGLVELAAITAIPYRGEAGAVATWHEYYMGNDPDPGDLDDPLKAQGYAKAQQEKADTAAEQAQLAALSQPQQAAEAASAPLQAALEGVDPSAQTDSVITNHATSMMEAAGGAPESTLGQIAGAVKQAVNTLGRSIASQQAQWMADQGIMQFSEDGQPLSPEAVEEAFRARGQDLLPLEGTAEVLGAAKANATGAIAPVIAATETALSRGRNLIKDPADILKEVRDLKDSGLARTRSEALGVIGGRQARDRLGHTDDPRFVNRYHGPDDMTRSPDNKLTEWEDKGRKSNSTDVAENKDGHRQGSSKKNARRATQMTQDKARKVDQPSNRQGGPYTVGEIDLWQEILTDRGQKQHMSTHTNVETGQVQVIERDNKGNPGPTVDRFEMQGFDQYKTAVEAVFDK